MKLSNRAYNGLKRNGISTISELLGLTEERLYSFNQMGAKTVAEICEVIRQLSDNTFANIKEIEGVNYVKEDFTVLDWAWNKPCALDKLYYEIVGIKKGTKDIELLLEDEKVTLQIKSNV